MAGLNNEDRLRLSELMKKGIPVTKPLTEQYVKVENGRLYACALGAAYVGGRIKLDGLTVEELIAELKEKYNMAYERESLWASGETAKDYAWENVGIDIGAWLRDHFPNEIPFETNEETRYRDGRDVQDWVVKHNDGKNNGWRAEAVEKLDRETIAAKLAADGK